MTNTTTTTTPTIRRCAIVAVTAAALLLASFCDGSFLDIGRNRDNLSIDMDEVLRNFGRARRLQREEARRLQLSLGDEQGRLGHDHSHDHLHHTGGEEEDSVTETSVEDFVDLQQEAGGSLASRQNLLPPRDDESAPPADDQPFIFNGVNLESEDSVEEPEPEPDEEESPPGDVPADEVTPEVVAEEDEPTTTDIAGDEGELPEDESVPEVTNQRPAFPPVFADQEEVTVDEDPEEDESAPEVTIPSKPPARPMNDTGFFAVDESISDENSTVTDDDMFDMVPIVEEDPVIVGDETLDVSMIPAPEPDESGPRGGDADLSPGLQPTEISFMIVS